MKKKITKFKLNKDFRRLYGRGKSFVSPYEVTYVMKNRTGNVNLGITAGKKIGNAVCRNRAKRLLTAAFREVAKDLNCGVDVVLVARTRILSVKSTVVLNCMREQFAAAGFLNNKNEKIIDCTN